MNKIDITMSATVRPSLLERTLSSFTEKMLTDKNRYRLIINIDPIGESIPRKEVLKVAQKYFDDIIYNYPDLPGFCKAVMWCWGQTKGDYIFHLEDDWSLLCNINIDSMINILDKNPKLVSLRLNKDNTGINKQTRSWGFMYYPKISLNPTLFKGNFIREVVELMDPELNPEKQLRATDKHERGRLISLVTHGIYTKDSTGIVVRDIGREWMDKSKFSKEIGFTEWKEKK